MGLEACSIGRAFAEVVAVHGERRAIYFDDALQLSYVDLDRLANRAARFLIDRGIRTGDRIAIALEKSPAAYALMLAAVKLGAPYVALDPRNPASRRDAILAQCRPSIVFASGEGSAVGGIPAVDCDPVERMPAFCATASDAAIEEPRGITGATPAYVMFTSGSTGTPKGAAISHDNLLHFIAWLREAYGFRSDDVHTHLNPLYFDNSVFDIYSTFFTGGTLVPFDAVTVQDPFALTARVRATACTTWFSVPSLLMFLQVTKLATRAALGPLRRIIFGGEGFPKVKLKALFDEMTPGTELHNVYGPTECTCICSSRLLGESDFIDLDGIPMLGRLADHFSELVLDDGKPVAPGECGELFLGGPCVGLGYFGRADLTSVAFVQNPLQADFREIFYRTGDLVRRDPHTGELHFVGRRDLQVKHMGYRIELEEIEHALLDIEGVDEAAVLHRKQSEMSELIAVVASRCALRTADVRRMLGMRLPKYMLPTKIHFVNALPKNANGKTDRPALKREYAS
ncbi:MAG: amino acid adenylation domain-containing protein [Gammaproteobacteria bacterium]|nr:amino acid adenylation domain-containing protein [Gammaproteobacteria bacterium]MBI5616598.1 amino acid adenylation domain-containing protein [Gammaproteobacteria bacterium]